MKIQFYLRFHTKPGQTLFISGNIRSITADVEGDIPMEYVDATFWQGLIEVSDQQYPAIAYYYALKNQDGTVVNEWGNDRLLDFPANGVCDIQVIDTWNHAGEFENIFYSAPFQRTLLPRKEQGPQKKLKPFTHIFKVKAPLLNKEEVLCLSGSAVALGVWDTGLAVPMTLEGNWWVARINLPKESFPLAYKYGVQNKKHHIWNYFENGNNRLLHGDAIKQKITICHDGFVQLPNDTWRGAGMSIPVFSLRTSESLGVGEFLDLKLAVDWANKTAMKLIQILPVNDTTATLGWSDSYPYAAISAFALHPIYLNIEKCAGIKYGSALKGILKKRKEFNECAHVDYVEVMKYKLSIIKELHEQQKDDFLVDEKFLSFFDQAKDWLVPYAAFCCLRDRHGSADFTQWNLHKKYDKPTIEKFASTKTKHFDSISFQYFIQYHLHLQLSEAARYAHRHGVILKGDIPIGIYRYSCDAWMNPDLFHMDMQAGAPPDNFASKGQNWGFPTYNWEQMSKDGFSWWKKRFAHMANYFDGFRIDHILGFFRIWSIPMEDVNGIMGQFNPAIPIQLKEFQDRNIWFNSNRYTKPFINEAVLWEFFAGNFDAVKEEYLEAGENGNFSLKTSFDTQRKVELHFAALEKTESNVRLCAGLFELISNVILFQVPYSSDPQFHFRIAMEKTSSFRYLAWDIQQKLKSLYNNYFFERQDLRWRQEAMKKLPALKRSTNMLVFGEDLGMVPPSVPDVLKQLGILSLEIQRMPKTAEKEFFHPADAPYLSVVTPSTHDMSTIRGWWEEDRDKTQRFFNQELGLWGVAPMLCEPWISKSILIQHLYSPAIWSIFQVQDLLGMSEHISRENPHDERINIPANPNNQWKYRMHIPLEDLIKNKQFNEELKSYVQVSGRV